MFIILIVYIGMYNQYARMRYDVKAVLLNGALLPCSMILNKVLYNA